MENGKIVFIVAYYTNIITTFAKKDVV